MYSLVRSGLFLRTTIHHSSRRTDQVNSRWINNNLEKIVMVLSQEGPARPGGSTSTRARLCVLL
jgi:hypothetical protein